MKNNCANLTLPAKEMTSERGVTILEFVIATCALALVGLIGIPTLETSVTDRIDIGSQLWSSYELPDDKVFYP